MKEINGGTQMRDVWTLPAIAKWEKSCGKHPTQKPLPLLSRIILASTILGRRYLGLERETEFLKMSKTRREELNDIKIKYDYYQKISKYANAKCIDILKVREPEPYFGKDLDLM